MSRRDTGHRLQPLVRATRPPGRRSSNDRDTTRGTTNNVVVPGSVRLVFARGPYSERAFLPIEGQPPCTYTGSRSRTFTLEADGSVVVPPDGTLSAFDTTYAYFVSDPATEPAERVAREQLHAMGTQIDVEGTGNNANVEIFQASRELTPDGSIGAQTASEIRATLDAFLERYPAPRRSRA